MQPQCAMRFESHTPKSLAMRKPISLIGNHKKIAEKSLRKSCDVGLRCEKSACFLRSSDAKCLRFGLSLQFGLRCERPPCQIASDAGRAMRTSKALPHSVFIFRENAIKDLKIWRAQETPTNWKIFADLVPSLPCDPQQVRFAQERRVTGPREILLQWFGALSQSQEPLLNSHKGRFKESRVLIF